ncbi:MAG: hypothetical protein GC179_10400 [Anaerolineaceae bacterium]|nr:hypothetical protein [Anaerolineaceae bacterium]
MGYAEASQIIHAPIETVWNTLNDIENTSKWVVGLEKAEMKTIGDFGQDSIYTDYNRLGPIPQVTDWRITEYEPMARQVHMSSSEGLPSTMTLSLSPAPQGTLLKMTVDYQFMPHWGSISRIFEALIMNRMLRSVIIQNMSHLNSFLQHSARNKWITDTRPEMPTLKLRRKEWSDEYERVE